MSPPLNQVRVKSEEDMMKKSTIKIALLGALVTSSAFATEWRTPWVDGQGPLRYTFEKLKKDKYNLNFWSTGHVKEAHKAYIKHGTKSKQLTNLIFNKSDFTLNEIYPDSTVPFNVENYSPFLKLLALNPRASYMEYGMAFGGRWEYPIWKDKGRIGLRATVPFRRVEIERDDITDKNSDPLKDFVASKVIRIDRNNPRTGIYADINAGPIPAGSLALQINTDVHALTARVPAGSAAEMVQAAVVKGGGAVTDAQAAALIAQQAGAPSALAAANAVMGAKAPKAALVNIPYAAAGVANAIGVYGNDDAARALARTTALADDAIDAPIGEVIAAPLPQNAGARNEGAIDNLYGQAVDAGSIPVINAINKVAGRGDKAAPDAQADVLVSAYRLDYVQSLVDSQHRSAIQPTNTHFRVFDKDIVKTAAEKNLAHVGVAYGPTPGDVVAGFVAWQIAPVTDAAVQHIAPGQDPAAGPIVNVGAALNGAVTAANVGYFNSLEDYSTLNFDTDAVRGRTKNLWMTFRRAADATDSDKFAQTPTGDPGDGGSIARNIEYLSGLYTEHPLVFMSRKGYELETQIRAGMGDIDVDLFYEHTFNKDWMGELCVGVRLPTGGDQDKYGNPYKALLGNGEHWEVKLGGLLAYQPLTWMNVKVDASYSFVIEGTEHRMAAFQGAQIKNMGPRADADVDWGYLVGHVDFNFFHPKTSDLRATFGYEIYYKTEDHLTYKASQMESWLGKQYNNANQLVANPKPLSNSLARKNTESIAHKVRFETSAQLMKYFELFVGGSTTFAGQHVMQDRDLHLGFNTRF